MHTTPNTLIILDRDGVINHDSPDYIKSPAEWHAITGSCQAIAKLKQHGFVVAVATNQSGIGRGLYNVQTYNDIERTMCECVARHGGSFDNISYCPHTPQDNCQCRKPKPGMLIDLCTRLQHNAATVDFVGDSIGDIQAARAAGCRPVLVLTGNGWATRDNPESDLNAVEVFPDLASYAINRITQL